MLFNYGRFGRLVDAIVKSLFVNPNSADELTPTPPADHLRTIQTDAGIENRVIDDGDYRSVQTDQFI